MPVARFQSSIPDQANPARLTHSNRNLFTPYDARASSKLARLEQAINNTIPAITPSMSSLRDCADASVLLSRLYLGRINLNCCLHPLIERGLNVSMAACACERDTPV